MADARPQARLQTGTLPTVAVVGARGLVGHEALKILCDLGWPSSYIRVFGSPGSVGNCVAYGTADLQLESIDSIIDHPPDYALLCADATTAIEVTHRLAGTHTTIIDNSSAFRMGEDIPLVIPEVNGSLLNTSCRMIANPNCSTIMLLTALNPLRAAFGVRSVQVSTYQAVSGAGRLGLECLHEQTRAKVLGRPIPSGMFPVPCAFDVFEHESTIDPVTGFNGEESKMIAESRKIWRLTDLRMLPTCVRVPVERAHAQAITVELNRTASVECIRSILRNAPGVCLANEETPLTPASIAGLDEVFVGRVRVDPDDTRRVLLWVCCDQIRKGAALNAIQIMQRLMEVRSRTGYSSRSERVMSLIETPGYARSS